MEGFNKDKIYPVWTLLLRNYFDIIDQGHLAIVYENSDGLFDYS
jgi:hypothetical protein